MWRGLVLLCAASAACAASLPHPPYSAQPTEALVSVPHAPPPARVEAVPARPQDDAVWIDGEWTLRRARWVWLPGRWVLAPPAATYSPWVTVRAPDGALYFAPGAWRDAHGQPIAPPKALSIATVESGTVIDAEGEAER
jgi:hypothetical protein